MARFTSVIGLTEKAEKFLEENCAKRKFKVYDDEWWDAERFNWENSRFLASHCHQFFGKWWDADRFNWKYGQNRTNYLKFVAIAAKGLE